jgi:hypothetical protein
MGKKYKLELTDSIAITDSLRSLMKSGNKVGNKSAKEIEQYVGNKDRDVISEFERLRENGKKTKVTHRLWRRFGDVFKKVHEHEK